MSQRLLITEPTGESWAVYDELYGPPALPAFTARVVAPGSDSRAAHRLFVRQSDRTRVTVLVQPERQPQTVALDPETLLAQLSFARLGGIEKRPEETIDAFLARLDAECARVARELPDAGAVRAAYYDRMQMQAP